MPAPHHSVFLQTGCPSCRPTISVKALKAIIIIIMTMIMFMLLLSKLRTVASVYTVHLMNVDWALGGRQPTDHANRSGRESAKIMASTICSSPSLFVIITQPVSWYLFYHPVKGGRLSWPTQLQFVICEWVWIGRCRCQQFNLGCRWEAQMLTPPLLIMLSRRPIRNCAMLLGATLKIPNSTYSGSVSHCLGDILEMMTIIKITAATITTLHPF